MKGLLRHSSQYSYDQKADDEFFLMNDIYDHIFKNEQHIQTDFVTAFPESYLDNETATIYLAINGENPKFKITIQEIK